MEDNPADARLQVEALHEPAARLERRVAARGVLPHPGEIVIHAACG